MSAPESIFLNTGIKGPTQNISAESLNSKTNAADMALFVSVMEQYAPSQSSKMESWGAQLRASATSDQSERTGKSLPALPEDLPLIDATEAGEGSWWGAMVDGKVVRAPWLSDAALEEFAVDLGIDRSLARLLLRETMNVPGTPNGITKGNHQGATSDRELGPAVTAITGGTGDLRESVSVEALGLVSADNLVDQQSNIGMPRSDKEARLVPSLGLSTLESSPPVSVNAIAHEDVTAGTPAPMRAAEQALPSAKPVTNSAATRIEDLTPEVISPQGFLSRSGLNAPAPMKLSVPVGQQVTPDTAAGLIADRGAPHSVEAAVNSSLSPGMGSSPEGNSSAAYLQRSGLNASAPMTLSVPVGQQVTPDAAAGLIADRGAPHSVEAAVNSTVSRATTSLSEGAFSGADLRRSTATVSASPSVRTGIASTGQPSLNPVPGASEPIAPLGAESPLADEDVLRWRAASARSAQAELSFKPLGIEALSTQRVVSTLASSVTAADFARAEMPGAVEKANILVSAPNASVAILPSVGLFGKDGLSRKETLSSKETSVSIKAMQTDSSIFPESIDVESLAETLSAPQSSNIGLLLSANNLRQQSESLVSPMMAAGTSSNTILSGATTGSLNILDPATALARPLPLPVHTLDYDTRVEQFAEQVGQRLIQQMRSERWTVSLQLDPQNLGPLDIALEIDGADVRANLAVMNADVRALLDAGMPRLRDTLEAAGYQLSGWSLADSAGRDAAAQQQFAQGEVSRGAFGAARKQDLDDRELGAGVVPQGLDNERGIDLYV